MGVEKRARYPGIRLGSDYRLTKKPALIAFLKTL